MRRWLALLLTLAALPATAQDERIVAGLSQARVAITTDFSGQEILVYDAVRRDAPPPDGPALQVIVTVAGPQAPVTVRRKARVRGIWVNTDAVRIDAAPSFYAVATTAPLDLILSATEDLRHRITIPRAIRAIGIAAEAESAGSFVDALIRLRTAEGRYGLAERRVVLTEDTLFRADVALPADLTEGNYRVRIFLIRGDQVIDTLERLIDVRKAGLEQWIYDLSQEAPLLYGLLALALAAFAGWGSAAAFRLIRP